MLKKSDGDSSIAVMIVSMIALIIFMMVIVLQLDATTALSKKNEINHICDSHLEMMMADGCLTESNKQILKKELEAVGCYNISFSGSTVNEAGYAEKICLKVTYSLKINVHSFASDTISDTVSSSYQRYTTCYK